MKFLNAILVMLLLASTAMSATGIAGKISRFFYEDNKPTLEPYPKVSIHLVGEEEYDTVSDEEGYYALKAPLGEYVVVIFMENLDGVSFPVILVDEDWLRIDVTFIFHNKAKKETPQVKSAHLR